MDDISMWLAPVISILTCISMLVAFAGYIKRRAKWETKVEVRLDSMCESCPKTRSRLDDALVSGCRNSRESVLVLEGKIDKIYSLIEKINDEILRLRDKIE